MKRHLQFLLLTCGIGFAGAVPLPAQAGKPVVLYSRTWLAEFGMKWEERYTDIKGLALAPSVPVIGGLKWGYYAGNTLVLSAEHPARPQAWVPNDLKVLPLNSSRNEPGVLLAAATLGQGRFIAVTDAGWIGNPVLEGKGIAGVVVLGDNNVEIFQRLIAWSAGAAGGTKPQ
jgi:hypothetical protein